jgi:hypothetical protein
MNIILGLIIFCVAASIGCTIIGFGVSVIAGLAVLVWDLGSSLVKRVRPS